MRIRRCAILLIEPRESAVFDFGSLLRGGDGVARRRRLVALAAHLDAEVEIDAEACRVLTALSPGEWTGAAAADVPEACLAFLLESGLVLSDAPAHAAMAARDQRMRDAHWHPLAATLHAFTRWDGVEAVAHMRESGLDRAEGLRASLGPPPAADPPGDGEGVVLPWAPPTAFDALLARRTTCRNFDTTRALPFDSFAQVLQRVFAAQAQVHVADDTVFMKKNVPSGGGLHPIDCHLVLQRVEGMADGIYRYDPLRHALHPQPAPGVPVRAFLEQAMAGQHWFADAHCAAVLVPRFDRSFWKYRQHAKAYRVVLMEAGHLSQMLYLAATEAGLGAFVTGAVNDRQLERALGLDPARQGILAIGGFGWRAPRMETAEFDPAGEVWSPRGE